ncbi:MAG: type I restriction endonuclease subunit R, partial [Lactobacillus sp.]|nr:type I restriction endonuclease subunit R [Lactobacillus sp.]
QNYAQALAAIKTYDELDKQDKLPASAQVNVADIPPEIENTLEGTYQNIIDNLKAENKNDDDPVDVDLDEDYELESIHIKEVDERYIMSLIQDYISTANQRVSASQKSEDQSETSQVGDYIDQYAKTNEPRAKHIRSIWQDVQL